MILKYISKWCDKSTFCFDFFVRVASEALYEHNMHLILNSTIEYLLYITFYHINIMLRQYEYGHYVIINVLLRSLDERCVRRSP